MRTYGSHTDRRHRLRFVATSLSYMRRVTWPRAYTYTMRPPRRAEPAAAWDRSNGTGHAKRLQLSLYRPKDVFATRTAGAYHAPMTPGSRRRAVKLPGLSLWPNPMRMQSR